MPPATSDSSALDNLWTPQALVATVLAGEALAIVMTLASAGPDRWVTFGLLSLLVQWVALAGLGAIYLLRTRLARLPITSLAWVCLGLLLVAAYLVGIVAQSALFATTGDHPDTSFLPRLLGITMIVGLLALVAFQNYSQSRRAALRAKQAELEALQARLHPHFLFNTLNSAMALIHDRSHEAERILLDMSDLFRAALSKPGWVSLAHELDLCRRYLAIEQARFGERLQVHWEIASELEPMQVPLLSLQPLIENAVAHGIERGHGGKSLSVTVEVTESALVVEVGNPAAADVENSLRRGHHIGLAGVRARLESATDGGATLTTRLDGQRFTARVVVPRGAMPLSPQASTR